MKWLGVVALAACLIIAGCGHGGPKVTAGLVLAKEHTVAHDESSWITICAGINKYGACTLYVPIEDIQHIPEGWSVRLQTCTTRPAGQERCRSSWNKVTPAQFPDIPLGGYWSAI